MLSIAWLLKGRCTRQGRAYFAECRLVWKREGWYSS